MDPNSIVTVVNRTSKALHGTFNGRPYDLPPGESQHVLKAARYFRYQNPVMGKGTPMEDWNVRSEYLVAIKELGDDCTPIEQSDAPQRWNTYSVNGPNAHVINARGATYGEAKSDSQLVGDIHGGGTGFVKP